MLKSFTIDQLYVGLNVSSNHVITDKKIKQFADISGDFNPIHLDPEFAELPGQGCIYLSQNLSFKNPVYINDTVVATIEVIAVDFSRKRVQFRTYCTVNNKIVIDGEAEIYIPD